MNNSDEDEYFPWLVKFTPLLNAVIENTNYDLLYHLLTIYEKNVSRDYCTCFLKRFKSIMLKNHIKNTLNFFHFYWRNVKERVSDHYPYLNKMSDILKIYLDLEVRIHTKHVDSANILTALCLYLDNSEEHIFKILLNGRYETEALKNIYCPIFAKLLSNIKSTRESIINFTYARYLLAFKLWERIVDNRDEKLKITDMAMQKLGSSMPQMDSELSKIIPKPPNGYKNATWWLMVYGLINLQKTCDDFLELEEKMHSFSFDEKLKIPQIDIENYLQEKTPPVQKKVKPSVTKLKKNQVLLIDITSDNDEVKQIITKKKKTVKKPQWLKEIETKKTNLKNKFKKPQPISKRTKSVEVADAHSTENCDNIEKSCVNKSQKCDVTLNNSNETNSNLININTTSLNDSYYYKSSDSHQDVVHSSTTCVTSNCDTLNSSVLNLEPKNAFDYSNEDISSQSDTKLLSNWDNASDKDDFSEVWRSMTFGDHFSESSSGIGTDYNSIDSEIPDTLTSPPWEIFFDSYKTLQEEIYDEPSLGGSSTLIYEPQTFGKSLLSRGIFNSSPSDFFYSNGQEIDPNLIRKKPEEVNDNEELVENEVDISEDLDELFEKQENVQDQMQNEVSSTSPPIHYRKSSLRRNLKETSKSSISFDLEELFHAENLVHGCLPFKKRYLSERFQEKSLSLFSKADL